MPTPWIDGIQKAHKLTLFPGPQLLKAPAWGQALFQRTLQEFNRLANVNKFGVVLVRSKRAPQADGTGANVQLEVTSGVHEYFDENDAKVTGTLDVSPGAMRGVTYPVPIREPGRRTKRAFCFVPIHPVARPGREIGGGIKTGLALHELLHACGLNETDTPHRTANDIYRTGLFVQTGATPKDDKFTFSEGTPPQPDKVGQFKLTADTVSLVQAIWGIGS